MRTITYCDIPDCDCNSDRSAMVYLSAKEMEKLDVLEGDNDIEKIKILKKVAKEYDIELE